MNGPFYLSLLLMAGGMAAGTVIHFRAMRGEQREAHAMLAMICVLSSAFLLIEARLWVTPDIDFYICWRHAATVVTATFMAVYPWFVARATGSRRTIAPAFFTAGAALLMTASLLSPTGRPWLASIDGFTEVVMPWGEVVFQPQGGRSLWFFVFMPLWVLVGFYGLWRGLRSHGRVGVVGSRGLILSNLYFIVAVGNDGLIDRGWYGGLYLADFIPAALTIGIWWQLSLVERRRVESYRDLFARSGDAMLIHAAASGTIVDANEAACTLFRRARGELIGAGLDTILSPDAPLPPDELARRLAEVRAAGVVIRESRLRRADGAEFPAEISLRLESIEGEERIVASIRDLTDRARVERALIDNEHRLRAIVSRGPVAIVQATLDGHVTAVNPRFTELFGHREEGARDLGALADPGEGGDAAARLARWRRLLAGARAESVIRSFRAALVDGQGRQRPVDICGVVAGEGAVLFVTDLTDMLAARDEIARREAFYRVLVEVASDGICVLDFAGPGEPTVAVWNPRMAELTGLAAARAVGAGWIERIGGGDEAREGLRALVARMREATLRDEPWTPPRRGGEDRVCSVTAVELPRALGERRVLVTARDVTGLARAEIARRNADAQVRHAQKLESLGILAGGIAHDFNNILMPILGRAGLMSSRLGESHPSRGQLRDMEQASRRAAELCQQLLAYAGKGRARAGPFDLGALVAEMARVLSVAPGPAAARVITGVDTSLPPILGDPSQVRQVVMNLITNAVDATGPGGAPVSLRVRRRRLDAATPVEAGGELAPGDYVALEVVDAGCGMDEATRRRVFEPFFTTKPTGRGLGMAAVLGVVRGHGGGLQLETAVGRGTTMRVLFPAFAGAMPEQTPAAPAPILAPGGTILVVDDEDSIRRTTRDMLAYLGFEVVAAASGLEAVAEFARARERVRAVVLDLTMPDMDGAETLRRLRAIEPRVRVVVASGYSRDEVARTLSDAEVAAFLQKPYDVDALAGALHLALGSGAVAQPRV